jgi:hypothetical protein
MAKWKAARPRARIQRASRARQIGCIVWLVLAMGGVMWLFYAMFS